jgi:type IV secretory pathway VirB9-like protein
MVCSRDRGTSMLTVITEMQSGQGVNLRKVVDTKPKDGSVDTIYSVTTMRTASTQMFRTHSEASAAYITELEASRTSDHVQVRLREIAAGTE